MAIAQVRRFVATALQPPRLLAGLSSNINRDHWASAPLLPPLATKVRRGESR